MIQINDLHSIPYHLVNDDFLRTPILLELADIPDVIISKETEEDPYSLSIVLWKEAFLKALKKYTNLSLVKEKYLKALNEIFYNDLNQEFPKELFGTKLLPVVHILIKKMCNPNSLLYSKELAQVAPKEPSIPEHLIEQLRQIEKKSGLAILQKRLQKKKIALETKLNQATTNIFKRSEKLKIKIEEQSTQNLKNKEIWLEEANRLKRKAIILREESVLLERKIHEGKGYLTQLEKEEIQLKVEINQLKADIADRKSDTFQLIACIGLSIGASLLFKKPIIITPNGAGIGAGI